MLGWCIVGSEDRGYAPPHEWRCGAVKGDYRRFYSIVDKSVIKQNKSAEMREG